MSSLVFTLDVKKKIINGLKSSIIATRFMTVRSVTQLVDKNYSEIDRLEIEEPGFIEELLETLYILEAKDSNYGVRREAKICLETLRKHLSSTYKHHTLRCVKCNARLSYGWLYCSTCKEPIKKWLEDSIICHNCKLFCDSDWLYCTKCGTKIREELASAICPRCQKIVDSTWLLCPYCGTQLK